MDNSFSNVRGTYDPLPPDYFAQMRRQREVREQQEHHESGGEAIEPTPTPPPLVRTHWVRDLRAAAVVQEQPSRNDGERAFRR